MTGITTSDMKIIDKNVPVEMVWVDMETTGLMVEDKILEVGIKLTDRWGRGHSSFRSLVVSAGTIQRLDVMPEIVREMHTKSGLLDEIDRCIISYGELTSPIAMQTVEASALDWLAEMNVPCKALPLTGSSVHFDHNFMNQQMPILSGWFTHRNVDVSTVRELCKLHNSSVYQARLKQVEGEVVAHRVMADIDASIEEYRFYVDNFLFTA